MDKVQGSTVRMERIPPPPPTPPPPPLHLYCTPRWPASFLILIILGLLIEFISRRFDPSYEWLGILGFILPALNRFFSNKTDHCRS